VLPEKQGRLKIMPLLQILEVIVVVGVLLWLVNRFIPMQGTMTAAYFITSPAAPAAGGQR
jgi:hypothetical protein